MSIDSDCFRALAISIEGLEAAMFQVEDDNSFTPLAQFRGGKSTSEQRESALRACQAAAYVAVMRRSDAVFRARSSHGTPKLMVVHLVEACRQKTQVLVVVVQSVDPAAAKHKLKLLRTATLQPERQIMTEPGTDWPARPLTSDL